MYHYNLTLKQATGIVTAITGTFSGQSKSKEIIVSRGKTLALFRPDKNGTIQTILSHEVFDSIRSLSQLRLTGGSKDYIVVVSDSCSIVILEYNKEKNVFDKVNQETFGNIGSYRTVPGQYLAVDPKGRAVMIGACEEQKLVYVLNRDTAARLTISSPLEAHKSRTFCFCICGVDCGTDNPVFAAIELDYSRVDEDSSGVAANEAQKVLTFYELDLELNRVSIKWSESVDNGANMLVTVPGGGDGPSGVLVCAENFVIYKNQGHPDVRAVIPRRLGLPAERGVLIVSATMHKQNSMFFFLLQTEYGDVFKVSLDHDNERVTELKIKYFDTIPVTSAMCVMELELFFAASEFGDHALYKFLAIGADDPDVESSSATLMETEEGFRPVLFMPRKLKNLVLIDQVKSLMPISDIKVLSGPQIFTLCGRGPHSSLRILRPGGLAIREMSCTKLPGVPSKLWTFYDGVNAFIVFSLANSTLLACFTGDELQEIYHSGFLETTPSLAVSLIGDQSVMQVHPSGIRVLRDEAVGGFDEWEPPGKRTIVKVGYNELQVVIALNGGEIIYFEVDKTGQLMEVKKNKMSGDVACLDIAPVPEGSQRSRFLAVGLFDNTIRILSLYPEDCMHVLSVHSVTAAPESLLFLKVQDSVGGEDGADHPASLFLNAGLESGVLFRTVVDMVTGQLSDARSRFLGRTPPKLFSILVRGRQAMLCLSSRPWLGYAHQGFFLLTPLSDRTLEYAASFSSDQCAEGVIAVTGRDLRVFTIDRLGETFDETAIPLSYTPRKLVFLPEKNLLVIIESDQGAFPAKLRFSAMKKCFEAAGQGESGKMEIENLGGYDEYKGSDEQFGYPKAEADMWASCIRVLDPISAFTTCLLNLPNNEAAISICTVNFHDKEYGTLLAVGTATHFMRFVPLTGYIRIYQFVGRSLKLLHYTPVPGAPLALCQFQNRLLAGIGSSLWLYDINEKSLVEKCVNKLFPNTITSVHTFGDRIYVGDIQKSFHYCKYRHEENQLYVFADDPVSRSLTASDQVDIDTMAGADKFGNIYFVRLPQDLSDEIEEDPTGKKIEWKQGKLTGAPYTVKETLQFHVGDVVTCMQKASLVPGDVECMMYGTVMGSLGALLALSSRDDVDFFSQLETHMRQEYPPLCGRDHMAYRSSYKPVKDVIDGDLCEQYPTLPLDVQRKIAGKLDRSPAGILKKLEDIRNMIV